MQILSRAPAAVLWDMDGTLIDTEPGEGRFAEGGVPAADEFAGAAVAGEDRVQGGLGGGAGLGGGLAHGGPVDEEGDREGDETGDERDDRGDLPAQGHGTRRSR